MKIKSTNQHKKNYFQIKTYENLSVNCHSNRTHWAKHLWQTSFLKFNPILAALDFTTELQDLTCKPNILQQRDSTTDFLSENFLKFLKKSLNIGACLLVTSFLLKLKTIAICFKLHIFMVTGTQHLWTSFCLEIL